MVFPSSKLPTTGTEVFAHLRCLTGDHQWDETTVVEWLSNSQRVLCGVCGIECLRMPTKDENEFAIYELRFPDSQQLRSRPAGLRS